MDLTREEKRQYLLNQGWKQNWDDDNWVKLKKNVVYSNIDNMGIDTDLAYKLAKEKEEEMKTFREIDIEYHGEIGMIIYNLNIRGKKGYSYNIILKTLDYLSRDYDEFEEEGRVCCKIVAAAENLRLIGLPRL